MRTAKARTKTPIASTSQTREARIGDALDQQRILNVAIVGAGSRRSPVHPMIFYFFLALGHPVFSAPQSRLQRSISTRHSHAYRST